jgi:hypothetical protein
MNLQKEWKDTLSYTISMLGIIWSISCLVIPCSYVRKEINWLFYIRGVRQKCTIDPNKFSYEKVGQNFLNSRASSLLHNNTFISVWNSSFSSPYLHFGAISLTQLRTVSSNWMSKLASTSVNSLSSMNSSSFALYRMNSLSKRGSYWSSDPFFCLTIFCRLINCANR